MMRKLQITSQKAGMVFVPGRMQNELMQLHKIDEKTANHLIESKYGFCASPHAVGIHGVLRSTK